MWVRASHALPRSWSWGSKAEIRLIDWAGSGYISYDTLYPESGEPVSYQHPIASYNNGRAEFREGFSVVRSSVYLSTHNATCNERGL